MNSIVCGRCTTCCIDPIIPMNDTEVKAIMEATGLPAKKVVRFYSFDYVDWPKNEDNWVELHQGRRIMSLRMVKDRCLFLSSKGCTIYKHRPRVCRMFPVDITMTEGCKKYEIEVQQRVKNCRTSVGPNPAKNDRRLIGISRALCRLDAKYIKKVAKWNADFSGGTINAFLAYLGLS